MNKREPSYSKKKQPIFQPDESNGPTFALYLLGVVQLCLPTGGLLKATYWANDRQLALFIYLVLNRDHIVTPTEINHQFWPYLPVDEVDDEVTAVCQTLSHLLHLPSPIVRLHRGYQLKDTISCWLDIDQFDRLLSQAAEEPNRAQKTSLLQQAIALYRDDFLVDLPFKQKWITTWRAHFQQGYLVTLQTLSALYEQDGDLEGAQRIYLNLLKTGPASREYGRSVIDLFQTSSSPSQTLRQCKRLIALLQNELERLHEACAAPPEVADSIPNSTMEEPKG